MLSSTHSLVISYRRFEHYCLSHRSWISVWQGTQMMKWPVMSPRGGTELQRSCWIGCTTTWQVPSQDGSTQMFLSMYFIYTNVTCSLSCTFCSLNKTVDIWSVGCIMAELLTGRTLFPGTDRILPSTLWVWPIFWQLELEKLISDYCLETYGVESLCICWSETPFRCFELTHTTDDCELESRRLEEAHVHLCDRIPLWCLIQSCPLFLQDVVLLPVYLPQIFLWATAEQKHAELQINFKQAPFFYICLSLW